MSASIQYPNQGGGGGGGGSGITSINGNTTAAQIIAAGTGISVSSVLGTTTITNTGGTGTVTTVSVVSANGLSGTVANPTTTPAITLALALTGDVTISGAAATVAKIQGTTVTGTTGSGAAVLNTSPNFATQVTFGNYHLEPSEHNDGNSGTSLTIDWSTASAQMVTLTGNCTFTFSNGVTGGAYVMKLIQDSTGSRTVIWPSSVKWPGGTAPTLTTTAGQLDLINFYYDGTDWFGSFSLNYTP